jgi:hypothetical protein
MRSPEQIGTQVDDGANRQSDALPPSYDEAALRHPIPGHQAFLARPLGQECRLSVSAGLKRRRSRDW